MTNFLVAVFAVAATITSSAYAEPICDIAPKKKKLIENMLCGQYAREAVYKFSGTDCAKRSIKIRLQDSAAQIVVLRMCGHQELSSKVQEATLKTMEFMEILSVCTPHRINIRDIYAESEKYVASKSARISCTPSLRAKIRKRMGFFKKMTQAVLIQNVALDVYNKLGITISENGDIHERQ